ncbi:alanine--glyoxylate aminotransferase family protein [Myxococcota bacterium]|nr:alanine--glyoxylate aminotransferase family protein [Myxococcota bacterium]
MLKRRLFTPGPVPVPSRVRQAMAQPILNHRAADFLPVFERCRKGLQRVFQTESPVVILAASATGAMDSAVSNMLSPGDHALVVRGGKFGERWGEICASYGVRTTCIDVEWGRAVDPAAVERALETAPDIRAVYVTASETSTGVRHPVREIAEVVRRGGDRLLAVDAVTAAGVYDLPMDRWELDVVVSGSQKAFMLPPGLAFIGLSERAQRFMGTATCSRFYFDLGAELKALPKDQTSWTPAVGLLMGLDESLKIILEEQGLEETWARTEELARVTREAMCAIGLELLAPDAPSPATTAVRVPDGVEGPAFRKYLRDELGYTLADGQDSLKGKVFRIAHLGYFDRFDTIAAIAAIEMALIANGHDAPPGEATRLAVELLSK